jgi:hypothetical protein
MHLHFFLFSLIIRKEKKERAYITDLVLDACRNILLFQISFILVYVTTVDESYFLL